MQNASGSLNKIRCTVEDRNRGLTQNSWPCGKRTVIAAAIAMILASNMAGAATISANISNYSNAVDEDITVNSGVTVSGTSPVLITTGTPYASQFINNGTLLGTGPGGPTDAALQFQNGVTGSGRNNGSILFTSTNNDGAGVFIDGVLGGTFANIGGIGVTTTNANAHGINVTNAVSGTLSNAGDVHVNSAGTSGVAYGLDVGDQVSGQVINTGGVNVSATASSGTALATGIHLNQDVSGLLRNTGTINAVVNAAGAVASGDATATGMGIDGNLNGASLVSNTGAINATAIAANVESFAYGMNFNDRLNSGSVLNSGSLNATANGTTGDTNAYGIFINDGINIAVTNDVGGHISAIATSTDIDGAAIADGIYIQDDISSSGSLNNRGSIIAKADGDTGNALGMSVNTNVAGILSNSGTIDVSSSGFRTGPGLTSASAFGIVVLGDISDFASGTVSNLLTNSGTINVTAVSPVDNVKVAATGILVKRVAAGGRIENTGTINATAHAGANADNSAVGIAVADLSGVLRNEGSINASLNGGGGAVGLYIEGLSGVVNNTGVISGSASAGSQAYSVWVKGGTGSVINNLAGGKLIGGLQIVSAGVTVDNAGTLMLKNGVNLANVQNTGTATAGQIAGDYNQTATGVLHIAADGDGVGGYSQLKVDGTAAIAGNAFVDVKQVNTLAVGKTLSGVVSAGTLVGNFANVTDNSFLFNFESLVNNNNLDFKIVRGASGVYDAVAAENNKPATGVAKTIDRLIENGGNSAETQTLINAFGNLGSQREISNAASQTLPLMTASMSQVTANTLSSINRVVRARQDGLSGRSSGESYLADKNIWFKPFGSWANQNDHNGVAGYDADTYGAVFGADADISNTSRAGLAFAYASSNVDSNSNVARQSADIDTYQLIAYGSHNLSDTTDISFQADIGQNKNDGRRTINFGGLNGVATSSYDSWSGHVGAALAHTMKLSDRTIFTPAVRADYTVIREDAYRESGVAALNVDKTRTEAFVLGVDGNLLHAVNNKTNLTANFGVGYDLINDGASVTAAFAGAPSAAFTTQGIDPSPWLARGGVGIVGQLTPSMQISANYDFEVRENFNNQTASVKMLWSF